jgi:hypothetical protein
MKIPEKQEFVKELLRSGQHHARIIGYLDLGTQEEEYDGKKKLVKKIKVMFELSRYRLPGFTNTKTNEVVPERPAKFSKTYTQGLGEKHNLRKDIQRYKNFIMTDEYIKKFDFNNLIGDFCQVSLTVSKDGKYNVIEFLAAPIPEIVEIMPKQYYPTICLELDPKTFDWAVFHKLNEFDQATIKKSPEFQKLAEIAKSENGIGNQPTTAASGTAADDDPIF